MQVTFAQNFEITYGNTYKVCNDTKRVSTVLGLHSQTEDLTGD